MTSDETKDDEREDEAPIEEEAKASFGLGLTSFRNGRLFQAHQHFVVAVHDDPESVEALAYLGYTSLTLNPTLDDSGWNRGMAMLDDALKRNVELAEPLVAPLFLMGKACRDRAEKDTAREYFQKAQEIAPNDPDIQRELLRLDLPEAPPPPPPKAAPAHEVTQPAEEKKPDKHRPRQRSAIRPIFVAVLLFAGAYYGLGQLYPNKVVRSDLSGRYQDVIPLVSLYRVNLGWVGTVDASGPQTPDAAEASCEALARALDADDDETVQLVGPDGKPLASCRGMD